MQHFKPLGKIWLKCLYQFYFKMYCVNCYGYIFFRGLTVLVKTKSQWFPEVSNPLKSPNVAFPSLRCSTRPLLQQPSASACLWVSLHHVLAIITEKLPYWVAIRWLMWSSEKLLGFIFIMPRGWTAVTSSVDTRRLFPLAAIRAHSITLPLPNHVVSLRSWVVFFSIPLSSHHSGTLSLVSTVSPLLWSNLSLLFLSVTSSCTLLLSLCIYIHEAVTWI